MTADTPTLEIDDLTTAFGPESRPVQAVRGVSLSVAAGRTLVLLGESGSGKSVTLRSVQRLAGVGARYGGAVRYQGRSVLDLPLAELAALRGSGVAMVPQDPTASLDPLHRVGGQIAEVLRVHGVVRGRRAAHRRAVELLRHVGIDAAERAARSFPHELSGGMRQRVAIAIAVSCGPALLLADEPTTALDVTVQAQILRQFRDLQREGGMAMLFVTHDVGVAREIADDVAVMYAGRIVEYGPASEVLGRPTHPYTRALLAAVPKPGVERGTLATLPGGPPPLDEIPTGCAFADRCPIAVASCRDDDPALRPVSATTQVACPVAESALIAEAAR